METISQIDLPLKLKSKGKVRDIYELDNTLVMVTTDRISAFDIILPSLIPYKGFVLNSLSLFWFKKTKDIIGNHVLIADFDNFPENLKKYEELKGRTMIVRKAEPIKVECVVRGYITGSAWSSYSAEGDISSKTRYKEGRFISGIKLPRGLRESEKLPEPIFTPTTKETNEHDQELNEKDLIDLIGKELSQKLKETSLKIYNFGQKVAEDKGIIIADTKFEFGLLEGNLILIDELLTPDSSRFWSLDDYQAGRSQKSFDKQFVRDYLVQIGWDKKPPAPILPEEIIKKTSEKYIEAHKKIIS